MTAGRAARPRMEQAKERLTPAVGAAKGSWETARHRLGPATANAKETLLEDVVPRMSGAVASAADRVSEGATHLADRAQASVEKPRKRRWKKPAMMLGAFAAAGAGLAAVLRRRGEADQWKAYDPSAAPWVPRSNENGPSTAEGAAESDDSPATAGSKSGPDMGPAADVGAVQDPSASSETAETSDDATAEKQSARRAASRRSSSRKAGPAAQDDVSTTDAAVGSARYGQQDPDGQQ